MESLLEERLHLGANKWWKGMFEGCGEEMEEDHTQFDQNWRSPGQTNGMRSPPGNGYRRRRGTGW